MSFLYVALISGIQSCRRLYTRNKYHAWFRLILFCDFYGRVQVDRKFYDFRILSEHGR